MKRLLLLLVVFVMCLSLASCDVLLNKARELVTGEEVEKPPKDFVASFEDVPFNYDLYEEYIILTKYTGDELEVVVPSEIDGVKVTTIGSGCFNDLEIKITSVKIPNSVTTIQDSAFFYADALVAIEIPDSVTSLGERAFSWCNSLQSVTFGKGITEIPDYCFNHCSSLKTLELPTWINKIGTRAFSYCESLAEFTVRSNINELGNMVFYSCPVLKYVVFENGATNLGENVFAECPELAVIAPENSTVMEYCRENGLRFSTSKDIEAVILGKNEVDSSEASEESK